MMLNILLLRINRRQPSLTKVKLSCFYIGAYDIHTHKIIIMVQYSY